MNARQLRRAKNKTFVRNLAPYKVNRVLARTADAVEHHTIYSCYTFIIIHMYLYSLLADQLLSAVLAARKLLFAFNDTVTHATTAT